MSTIDSAKRFAQVAVLHQKALLQQTAQRIFAGALAAAALLVALGLATFALFLVMRPATGDLNAVLLITGAYAAQLEIVQSSGAVVILMASRALAAAARDPRDYLDVYGALLKQASKPVMLHWLSGSVAS